MDNKELAQLSVLIKKPEQLYSAIFAADFPEKVVPKLPVQSLYLTIQARGIESSTDLLPLVTKEQYERLLHFDFWTKDNFVEDNFWQWFEAIDEKDSLKPLQKFLQALDRSLLSLLVFRYLDVVFHEEPSEAPPGDNFYSPDKGHTWLSIKIENEDRLRLFGKLLAFIFERDAKFFYQLIGISKLSTQLELEETAYEKKTKELSDEGIPDFETAWNLHAEISKEQIHEELKTKAKREIIPYGISNLPLSGVRRELQPFNDFINSIREHSDQEYEIFLSEMSLIVNAATIYLESDFSDYDEMTLVFEKIRGAINIALEDLAETGLANFEIYQTLGAQKLYRLGLTYLRGLTKQVKQIPANLIDDMSEENKVILEYALDRIPSIPAFFIEGNQGASAKLEISKQAYSHKKQLQSVGEFLSQCLQRK